MKTALDILKKSGSGILFAKKCGSKRMRFRCVLNIGIDAEPVLSVDAEPLDTLDVLLFVADGVDIGERPPFSCKNSSSVSNGPGVGDVE